MVNAVKFFWRKSRVTQDFRNQNVLMPDEPAQNCKTSDIIKQKYAPKVYNTFKWPILLCH